jgi:hypothetical protein
VCRAAQARLGDELAGVPARHAALTGRRQRREEGHEHRRRAKRHFPRFSFIVLDFAICESIIYIPLRTVITVR